MISFVKLFRIQYSVKEFWKSTLDPEIFLDENHDFVVFNRREKFQDDAWGGLSIAQNQFPHPLTHLLHHINIMNTG
jgi:hypothetical protein